MRVANWLDITELCVFDKAVSNKQLRAKYLSGLSSDTYLYPGAAVDSRISLSGLSSEYNLYPRVRQKTPEWQLNYAQWLLLRRVSVNSIAMNKGTTPSVLALYDIMNRGNPGLVSLSTHGDLDFYGAVDIIKDIGVRNVETLHTLELADYSYDQMVKVMKSVRRWESMGGSLQKLTLTEWRRWDEDVDTWDGDVDFGNCNSLTDFRIEGFGDSFGYSPVLWGILHKCANLKRCEIVNRDIGNDNDRDLGLLARFCPHLEHLVIHTPADEVKVAALLYVIVKCPKLQHLSLNL
jgi:hypothetical protein